MNKLVSKNPVLRFKEGRKIVKAEDGWRLINGKAIKLETSPNVKQSSLFLNAPTLTLRYIFKGKQYGSFDGGKTYYGLNDGGRPLSYKANQQILATIGRRNKPKVVDNGDVGGAGDTEGAGSAGGTGSTGNASFYQFGKMGGWNRSIGNSIDQDSLNMIKEMGMEGKSAQDIQNEINRVFGSNAVKVDNKWGNLSRAGLKALYERWQSLQPTTTETKPTITQPSITQTPEFLKRLRQLFIKEETPEQLTDRAIVNNVDNLQFKRNGNYNKSGIRNLIRSYGLKAYDFTGALRKALRQYLNGESNDTSLLTNGLEKFIVPYKQGGQLVSRNPIKRFKLKKFLVSGPVTTLKTGGEIPKLKTAWLPINWNDNNKFVDKVIENVSNGMKKALNRAENYRKANKVANRNTKAPLINNTAKLLQALYDKGFYNGVIDKRRTGKQVTLERAVDGYEGNMTNQAILNAINAGYTVNKNTGEITPPRKLAYGKTPKKLPQQLQQASTFSFDKLKSLGKEFYGRVFGDKDMLTGRNELEEKDYQRIYNTPYSWRLDMDKIGETDGGEAGYLYPQFDSKVGKLGLFNRQVDEDGRICYQIKNDKGQLVSRCSETGNLINRALGLPTTDDAWKRYGVYGDSLIYGQPDHNKFYTRPVGKVINGLRPDLLDPNNLKTGDFVDLYTEGSGHNPEAAAGRGNSHTGTIYKPLGNKGPVYIIHGGLGDKVYVDPLAQFGPTRTWSIMSVRRPGSKEHPYYED